MRIGIDARALTGRFTGDRTYWLNLVRAIQASPRDNNEYILYTRVKMPCDAICPDDRVRIRTVPASNDRVWTMLAFPRALKQDFIDLAHPQYTVPLRPPCPVITTVHA